MDINSFFATSSNGIRCYVGDMERKSDLEIPLKLESFTSVGFGAKEDFPNQEVFVADEMNENCPIAQPLPLTWHCRQQTSHVHVDFLPTSSALIHAGPASDVPLGFLLPVNSIRTVKGGSEFQGEMSYNNLGNTSHVINSNDREASINPSWVLGSDQNDMLDGETCDVLMARRLSPLNERESQMKLLSVENLIYAQHHALTTPKSIEERSNVSQPPTVTVAIPGLPSRQRATTPINIANRVRRARVSKSFNALQELLPHSKEGNRNAILDDMIDYVKYLQLQIKVLSFHSLGGEATRDPFIHLEGFGHYLPPQQMLSEPLEKSIGQLMEVNMLAATQLLESKGLYIMPMAMAAGLFQPPQ